MLFVIIDRLIYACIHKEVKHMSMAIRTDGLNVGLPDGQMGNSEVGHMNLGAGRIVYQDLAKINIAVEKKTLNKEQVLVDAFQYAKDNNKDVHFLLYIWTNVFIVPTPF